MFEILVPKTEMFNESSNEFVESKETVLRLEHSLVSISKWESKWKKPFFGNSKKDQKTIPEFKDYIRCMTLNQNVDPSVYRALTGDMIRSISEYVASDLSATWFTDKHPQSQRPGQRETVTSELVYYWMVTFNIPFECQKWHFSRLMALIRICAIKNNPGKKMSKHEIISRNRDLNNQRKKALHTKG